jgi:hypothetical protein
MKVTVDIENSKIEQFLNYLEKNNIRWSKDTEEILSDDLSEANIKIITERLKAIERDPNRLSPMDDFIKEMDKSLA